MTRAYIGLGSNLDAPAEQVRRGFIALATLPRTTLATHSRLYATPPWGRTDQPPFINAVAALDTALEPRSLLDGLLMLERVAGRERGESRWGPRTLDLDILLFGDCVLDVPGLHLPHPHLHVRAFALMPLAELAPDLVVPGHGRVADLLAALGYQGCSLLPA